MNKKNTKIGIWGFGCLGKAAVHYFIDQGYTIEVMDNQKLSLATLQNFANKNIHFRDEKNDKERFFLSNDFLLPSPGIDISKYYATYYNKWISELDFFQTKFKKPIIAITGSVGKTTIAHMLSEILDYHGVRRITGGNIGIPTFDLINQQQMCAVAIVEASSFQLEYCKQFAPNIAVITNFYPNHLDRHKNTKEYFKAKLPILAYQNKNQHAVLPFDLRNAITSQIPLRQRCAFFASYRPSDTALQQLKKTESLFYIDNTSIIQYINDSHTKLIDLQYLPKITFRQNWLILSSVLTLLDIPPASLVESVQSITLPEHRLEHVATINLVDFYNDSKSTTPASTQAAVKKLANRPIKLFLGGLSKGIDRAPLIKMLKPYVQHVYCFGNEAITLDYACKQYTISSTHYKTLKEAFTSCIQNIKPGDQVLFSPAGSSFDLYKNYQVRGNHFKKMVYAYSEK